MSNKLKLTITGGEDQGTTVELDLFTTLLAGRSRKAEIRLHDADVSGRHFEFVRGTSGCSVKDLSRNGLKVDGRAVGEGEIVPVGVGSLIEVGYETKLKVEELPGIADGVAETAADAAGERASIAADFFEAEGENTRAGDAVETETVPPATDVPEDEQETGAVTHGDFDEALTEAGEGETQEMKTRVGSMEEIYARKRQLDRASTVRRLRFGAIILGIMLALVAIWFVTGSRRHVSDAEDPLRDDGEHDLETWKIYNSSGDPEFALEYPRADNMRKTISADSNSVDIVTFLGLDRDVPFHIEFKRWSDPTDLQYSLEDSFERRIRADSEAGMTFELREGRRPQVEFFDNVFPGYCEELSQRGMRFVRTEFTRSMNHDLWHGVSLYFRNGDLIYQLRTEIPDMYWKRAGYRLTDEPHLAVFKVFSEGQWDSPGRGGLVNEEFSNDFLLQTIKRELSAERVSSWPVVESYINTVLVRTWGEKPVLQRMAMEYYKTYLDRLKRFYNERHLAYANACVNRDNKRMRGIFTDTKAVFGAMPWDRRSSLVYNPEIWTYHYEKKSKGIDFLSVYNPETWSCPQDR